MKGDRLYLEHIYGCISWVRELTEGGREAFLHDRKTQDAVIRNLQVMAESSQRLTSELKNKVPDVPWNEIALFRNVLAHGYMGLRPERVWRFVEKDMGLLEAAVGALIEEDNKGVGEQKRPSGEGPG